jgi:spore germination protein YaaH
MNEYKLRGINLYALGMEDERVWDVITGWKDGTQLI